MAISPSQCQANNPLADTFDSDSLAKATRFQNQVCNAILITLTMLGLPALAASLTRMSEIGWSSIMTMQCFALVVLATVSILRNRTSYEFRVAVILIIMLGLGVLGLWNYGHLGGGKLLLLVTVVLTAMFAGARWAYVALAIGATSLLVFGWLFSQGHISSKAEIATYQSNFNTWLTAAVTLLMLGGFISTGLSRILAYQRELLESLEKEASYTQALLKSTLTGLIVFDEDLNLESWNQHAEHLFRTSTGRSARAGLTKLLLPNTREVDLDSHLQGALEGINSGNLEVGLRVPTGEIYHYVISISPRVDHTSKITGVICVTQDITELKRSQSTLIHNAKLATLGEMTTSIAHEINQPLTALRLQIANLALNAKKAGQSEEKFNIEKVQDTLEKMDRQVERAARITNHMRIVGSSHDNKKERFLIGDLIQDSTLLLADQYKRSGIDLDIKLDDARLEFVGDEAQLEQVVLELLQNARDAVLAKPTASLKRIQVHLDKADKEALITVSDNGIGILEEHLDRVFEPFFTTKEVGQGTGLGLSSCHKLVADMGGKITVSSDSGGTTFTVALPLDS